MDTNRSKLLRIDQMTCLDHDPRSPYTPPPTHTHLFPKLFNTFWYRITHFYPWKRYFSIMITPLCVIDKLPEVKVVHRHESGGATENLRQLNDKNTNVKEWLAK